LGKCWDHMQNFLYSIRLLLALVFVAIPSLAFAGPPYITDDPEPTDYRHFEIYAFSEGLVAPGHGADSAAGLEINYGALPNLQISAAIPVGFSAPTRTGVHFELSQMEAGAKYRFLGEDEEGWTPQISFYPSAEFAIAADRSQETSTRIFLPLWAQKEFDAWTIFGGGGYRINPGPEGRNSWLTGIALTRAITSDFEAGVELVHETAETRDGVSTTTANFGTVYALNKTVRLVGSAGPVVSAHDTFSYYLGVEWVM
jgi:hypothetical protein